MKALIAIRMKKDKLATEILLDRDFMESNPYFVLSGYGVKVALESDNSSLAQTLIEYGYPCPNTLAIESITAGNY